MEKTKDNTRNEIFDWIVRFVLIAIIIILLLHNCSMIKKLNKQPTGNIDIIEIKCDKNDVCNVDKKDNNNKNNNNSQNNNDDSGDNTIPVDGDDNSEDDKLIVKDKQITWDGEKKANIFNNSMYYFSDVVAPESSNTYQFVVKNGTDYTLKYNINFVEDNQYHINMKYKLKKNDTYLINNYVSYNELNISEMTLNANSNDTYYLEWKWVSSSNDTSIGKTPDAYYGLTIKVEAESINE